MGALKAEAFKEANEYCIRQNKVFQAVKMESRPVAPFVVPEAELQFMCLKPGDADITRPKLKKEADTIIEVITPAR
ncbi:MAG TPA: hypothetical protein VN283_14855 [Thiobacillus sp.]|nr:hypothetical protein [Thiobacillus sp.]